MGLGIGTCCCGCTCCPIHPTGWVISFPSNWGSHVQASSCNMCAGMGVSPYASPVVTQYADAANGSDVWPDAITNVDAYVRQSFATCLLDTIRVNSVEPIVCPLAVISGLYRDPEEEGCRLVVKFFHSVQGRAHYYRSPVITDCCEPLILDLYAYTGNSPLCTSPPSTITATPVCTEEEEPEDPPPGP